MTTRHFLPVLLVFTLGCGTFLSISEQPRDAREMCGIAVNKRAVYVATLEPAEGSGIEKELPSATLDTIDPVHVLTVDAVRMPFASGKLVVKLTDQQLLKEVTIESQTDAPRATETAEKSLDAAIAVKKELDAKE